MDKTDGMRGFWVKIFVARPKWVRVIARDKDEARKRAKEGPWDEPVVGNPASFEVVENKD